MLFPCDPLRHQPGDHDLVAHVLVDLAAVVVDRVGGFLENAAEIPVHRQRAQFLGHRRRADDVDEQEKPLLRARPPVAPAHDHAEGALADQLRGLAQEDEQQRHQRGNHHRQAAREHRRSARSAPRFSAADQRGGVRPEAAADRPQHHQE
jgi:hypothetical protein